MALCNATLPYVIDIASQGWEGACQGDRTLARGLNVIHGKLTHRGVAESVGGQFHPLPFDTKR